MYVCLRGEAVIRIFPCMSNMAIYCCARWSMLLATFFVFFFTCTVHKIKYKAIRLLVWMDHFVTDDQKTRFYFGSSGYLSSYLYCF